jgi:hypothetical protein
LLGGARDTHSGKNPPAMGGVARAAGSVLQIEKVNTVDNVIRIPARAPSVDMRGVRLFDMAGRLLGGAA